jgi:hypothetical protein
MKNGKWQDGIGEIREYKEFIDAGGYPKRQFWKYPFVKNGKPLAWEEAMRHFKDRTGLPGPRNWSSHDFPEGKAEHDEAHPLKIEAEPFYKLAREPKKLALFEGGHSPPMEFLVPTMNSRLDEKLGPVKHE